MEIKLTKKLNEKVIIRSVLLKFIIKSKIYLGYNCKRKYKRLKHKDEIMLQNGLYDHAALERSSTL